MVVCSTCEAKECLMIFCGRFPKSIEPLCIFTFGETAVTVSNHFSDFVDWPRRFLVPTRLRSGLAAKNGF